MKNYLIRLFVFLFIFSLVACGNPASQSTPTQPQAISTTVEATATVETAPSATQTDQPTQITTPTAAPTDTPTPVSTSTITPTPTATETIGEQLKSHIVFFLLLIPGGKTGNKRTDACGNLKPEPIISKRLRTGDKIQDVQIALNMLFSVGAKYYGAYYNAMWDTQFTIENYQYIAKDDYMIIQFGGFFPYSRLSACDKHGIREQIWSTFFYYGFKEKTFKVADGFLIDRLGGD